MEECVENCMKQCMRKLALWHTPYFKPIINHDQLEPILTRFGFVPLLLPLLPNGANNVVWKKYSFPGGGFCRKRQHSFSDSPPPRPRLPYPRIDGLHAVTYRAFLEAINYYLEWNNIADLFHIRGMPLQQPQDLGPKWRRLIESENVYVYREGTLDQLVNKNDKNNDNIEDQNIRRTSNSIRIDSGDKNTLASRVVPLENIIVPQQQQPKSKKKIKILEIDS